MLLNGCSKHSGKGSSIKYVTLFLANFYPPSPMSHFVTHPGTPRKYVTHLGHPPIFSRPSTKNKPGQKPLVQILSQLFSGVFVREVLSEGLLSGRFCLGWFLFITPSVRIRVTTQS